MLRDGFGSVNTVGLVDLGRWAEVESIHAVGCPRLALVFRLKYYDSDTRGVYWVSNKIVFLTVDSFVRGNRAV